MENSEITIQDGKDMASLVELVRNNREEIVEGIAECVIWKEGRSWFFESFYAESGNDDDGYVFDKDHVSMMNDILKKDNSAIVINGEIACLGWDYTIKELADKIGWLYSERSMYQLKEFINGYVRA